ncbi:hypothetical protein HBI56_103170 [Parastagonospora nodorum]|uniref:G-protein coupled receptors family 3 profile domain-containing protein n=2 Tax=Phaeosphaeria nodorum (strain SN15 / ATCC MYA-4574 / FGSC 10173) TaxID=321614 RepID=A0A7U2FE42_PHANO|nr:hypothetical protein SNOG_11314 [Parastagonospora nodorum SN15]KAH3911506.1 hypothetical protein HBH56_135720 [Parastagonospora nodorum]EAT81022.1 hypothetical protein SNOG_11314 [Parastagonospora nodorum SN15]KAH3927190.1 hypothetical protein HBH54_157570 [Parastagonospora nodorum]KAH3949186.1 hypothetical protein HBH53_090820 [Parastagonospora nodorum]KAH3958907.1 hypothetical protein HBH51_205930 [Parastagonospora nodorum]
MVEGNSQVVAYDQRPAYRTAVVVLCTLYASLLALAQGYRAGRSTGKTTSKATEALVIAQGITCMAFIFSVGINIAGLGLATDAQCYAVIRVCIALYMAAKIFLTLFLLERVRVVRSPFIERKRDPIWIGGTIATVCSYLGVTAFEFIQPESELSRTDGLCRIGIQPNAAIGVIVLDTVFNVVLTIIFIQQLRPAASQITVDKPSFELGRKWPESFREDVS